MTPRSSCGSTANCLSLISRKLASRMPRPSPCSTTPRRSASSSSNPAACSRSAANLISQPSTRSSHSLRSIVQDRCSSSRTTSRARRTPTTLNTPTPSSRRSPRRPMASSSTRNRSWKPPAWSLATPLAAPTCSAARWARRSARKWRSSATSSSRAPRPRTISRRRRPWKSLRP